MHRSRRHEAKRIRETAADLAAGRGFVRHIANGDEQKFRRAEDASRCGRFPKNVPSYLASFTKGLCHDHATGLVREPGHFERFVKAIDSGDPRDFVDTPLGPTCSQHTCVGTTAAEQNNTVDATGEKDVGKWKSDKAKTKGRKGGPVEVRAWESQACGNTFDLEGPDAQAVTMPPAPALGSNELTAEIGEVYVQALMRDLPFTRISDLNGAVFKPVQSQLQAYSSVAELTGMLSALPWFAQPRDASQSAEERARKRPPLTGQTLFRGITPGDHIGPYISQFLLIGDGGVNCNDREPAATAQQQCPQQGGEDPQVRAASAGLISYGAITIDQRVRTATPYKDYLVEWNEWLDVQNGADLRGLESYDNGQPRRFITTPRDLATYVHYDALYEAYLNACLLMLNTTVPFDPGIPFQLPDHMDHQQGFAHFGGPHILTLVTEVATRALKAVRYQKFNVHRRLRPEALAARFVKKDELACPEINAMAASLAPILKKVAQRNKGADPALDEENYLLPMAFCEGSPMHPSYGAGHATVAGACVTILKAFFDHKHPFDMALGDATRAYVPNEDGTCLEAVDVLDSDGNPGASLTIEGELNKLASNIAIGRDWAGVHYFSDYIESLRMGEQIAIGILEEQKMTYQENFSMTVPLFDGGSIRI